MALNWDGHRENLQQLYLVQDKSLPKVMEEMNTDHNFFATKSQYVAQFKKRKWRKNITEAEWRYINKELQLRKGLEKDSTVYLSGILLSDTKVQKEIRRYVLPTFVPAQISPPCSETIQIRTPGPSVDNASDLGVSLWPCDGDSRKRSYASSDGCESRELKRHRKTSPSTQYKQHQHWTGGSTQKKLQQREYPYFGFQDYIRSLSNKLKRKRQPLLCGAFFQETLLSPAMSPTAMSPPPMLFSDFFLQHTLFGEEGFSGLIHNSVDSLQVSSQTVTEAYRLDGLYEPLAALLLPFNPNLDTQSNLEKLETDLRSWCVNIPRRTVGEFESTVGMLTGRPQLSAGLCFLELIVYLYSNNLLENTSTALQWVVDTLSHDGFKILCGANIPTFQQFKRSLLMHGVENSHVGFVEQLLHQDSELREVFTSSVDVHDAVLWSNNLRMIGILLDLWDEASLSTNEHFWKAIPDEDPGFSLTGESACLLSARGVNLFDGPDYQLELYCPLNLFLTAVRNDDYNLVKHLLSLPQGHSVWKTPGECRLTSPTPLHLAAVLSRTSILRLLLHHENIHAINYIEHEEEFRYVGQCDGCYWTKDFINNHNCYLFTSSLLQAAAATGNMETIIMLQEAGSSTNEPAYTVTGRTALQSAVSRGHLEMVAWLLKNGADPNTAGTGSTEFPLVPLQVAIERNDYDLVQLLLYFNANPNVPVVTSYGACLIEAAEAQDVDPRIISCLSAASHSLNLTPCIYNPDASRLRNCLTLAVQRGNFRSVLGLLAKGAQVDLMPIKRMHLHPLSPEYGKLEEITHSKTLPHWSIRNNISHDIIQLLIQNVIDTTHPASEFLNSLLHEAVRSKRVELVRTLLEKGAQVNSVAENEQFIPNGQSALHLAACIGSLPSPDMYLLLLQNGANVDARDDSGNTPLLLAALHVRNSSSIHHKVQVEVLHHLIGSGACLNVPPGKSGFSILQCVLLCNQHDLEFVTMLIDHGADVNMLACPLNGCGHSTALQIAAQMNNLGVVKLLLEKGADVNLRSPNNPGLTALQCAVGRKNKELVELLLRYGADVNAPASSLYDRGATALQEAVRQGDASMGELLLGKGADVNAPAGPYSVYEGRALCCAARRGHIKIAEILLDHGAHVNAIGAQKIGLTALELASEKGRLDMVQLLLNNGADQHLSVNRRYLRALKLAKLNFHLGIVSLLRTYRAEALEEENGPRIEEDDDDEDDDDEDDDDEDDHDQAAAEEGEEDLYSAD